MYVRQASIELMDSPAVFDLKWRPELQVKIEPKNSDIGNKRHEVYLDLNLKANIAGNLVMEMNIQQAAIVHIEDTLPEARSEVLNVVCPNLLFPYLREAVDNLAVKASLPPIGLTPVDFSTLPATAKIREQRQAESFGTFNKSNDDGVVN